MRNRLMSYVSLAALALLGICAGGNARAGDIYKCTNAQGGVAYQDRPCASGEIQVAIQVAATPNAPDAGNDDAAAAPPPPPPPPVRPVQNKPALPLYWVCTRPEDGSHYMSQDGITQPRMVPAGVLGIPGQSLSQAYGGANGLGVSAPGQRKIPINSSPQAAVAGDYVAIQDQCEPASPEQTCDYLHGEYDKIHEKLRRAFKDEQAVLQPREDELDQQLDGC
jgi:Domain of unknown function (DUF4124)